MAATVVYAPQTSWIDTLELDACLKESHKASVEVTEHPVEQGFAISDHARPKPREVTIRGSISDTPWDVSKQVPGRYQSAHQTMLDLWRTPRLIMLILGLDTYVNMALTEYSATREKDTGDALEFEATFKEVRQVTTQTTTVATKQPKARGKKANGTKPTQNATAPPISQAGAKVLATAGVK